MRRLRATLAAAMAALGLLAGCASVGAPPPGRPIVLQPGQALVFGRVRMLDKADDTIEYAPFKFDPWGEPFFSPSPRITPELRQLLPPGGALRHRSHPAPAFGEDGSFAWVLDTGEYELLGNPLRYGSPRFDPGQTTTLARFSVPPAGGAIYAGTLVVRVDFGLEQEVRGWSRDEAEYAIVGCRVADERETALARLRARFPQLPEPVVTGLMRVDSD